jgi:hypothetical protein
MSPLKDPPSSPSGTSTPKIAIKGFSLSSKPPKPGAKPLQSTLGKRPRSTFPTHDDSESEGEGKGRHEAVVAFGEGGAVRHEEVKKDKVLVIKRVGNRDWRGEARARQGEKRGKNLLPVEVQAMQEAEVEVEGRQKEGNGEGDGEKREGVDVVNGGEGKVKWGLSFRERPVEAGAEENGERIAGEEKVNGENGKNGIHAEMLRAQTEDEEAIAALTGERSQKKGPDLVIQAAPLSEEEAYRRSVAAAPDPSTLEDYERVPVEEFGAALLRGMGWNGEAKGKVRDVKRRQNLLGLGAKELKDAEELGAWVGRSDVKRLNGGRGGGGGGGGERRPKVSEFKREKERRDERREERGGSYRREKERERDGYRERERERDSGRDRDSYRERDRRR